jgi:hypothetical protein
VVLFGLLGLEQPDCHQVEGMDPGVGEVKAAGVADRVA